MSNEKLFPDEKLTVINFEVRHFHVIIQNSIKLVLPRFEGIYEMQIFFGCHNMYHHLSKMRLNDFRKVFELQVFITHTYVFTIFFRFRAKKSLRNLQVIERPREFFHSNFEQV